MKKAYIYSYTNKNTGKIYIGSRYSFNGDPEDDFNKKYFSSCKQKEFLDDLYNGLLIPNIICVLDQSWFPNRDLSKIIVDIEGKIIQAVWSQLGKEKSYNKHDRRTFVSRLTGPDNPVFGKHWTCSIESNRKKSESLKGHYISNETKQKISTSLKNYWNEENRKKQSEKCKGRVRSEVAKRKTSETLKRKYKEGSIIPPQIGKLGTMLGKHLTDEQKQKLKKNHWSKNAETASRVKQKLIESHKHRIYPKLTDEQKKLISQKALNRPKSKFLTPDGDIVYIQKAAGIRNHKDWKLLE